MGTIAARKANQIVLNAYSVLAIELLCAAQAADFRDPEHLGKGTKWIYDRCREYVSFADEDRVLSNDIRVIAEWMRNTNVLEEIASVIPIE